MYEPTYTINQKILKRIGAIEAAREMVEQAALVPAWEAKFRKEALSRNVHHGTHLEGNSLSFEQADKLVRVDAENAQAAEQMGVMGRDRDIQEVINYRKVMEWIDKWGAYEGDEPKYTEQMMKDIHAVIVDRVLTQVNSGVYRQEEVVVKNSRTGEITFRPPTFVEVPYQIEELFTWLNSNEGKDHHSVLRAGIVHYELARVHPFVDGNGRVARAMALLVLYSEGYDVKRFFSLEEYFDVNAASYYQALQSVDQENDYDLTYWLEYFTLALASQLDRVKEQVMKLSRDLGLKKKLGRQVALSEREISILELMQNSGGSVSSGDVNSVLPDVSVDTILRDLKKLVKKGLIKKTGKTKGVRYTLVG